MAAQFTSMNGPLGPRATVVDDTCYQALAGASLALQQERGDVGATHRIEARQVADLGAEGRHGRGGSK